VAEELQRRMLLVWGGMRVCRFGVCVGQQLRSLYATLPKEQLSLHISPPPPRSPPSLPLQQRSGPSAAAVQAHDRGDSAASGQSSPSASSQAAAASAAASCSTRSLGAQQRVHQLALAPRGWRGSCSSCRGAPSAAPCSLPAAAAAAGAALLIQLLQPGCCQAGG
jgi:hypothetical protein